MGSRVRARESAYVLAAAIVFCPTVVCAAERHVRAGENLQSVIDAAQPGDVILLQAGATFRGNFVLPVKPGATYITIRSAAADSLLPPAGTRITPAYAPQLAKIESGNGDCALRTLAGAHHWRLMFLEFGPNNLGYGEIVRLGETSGQTSLSQVPYELDIDRVYVHGHPLYGQKRGIALNARAVTIRNSWISDMKAVGVDTQAIGGWNGPGQYVIENNYLEASGENILFGGADPSIPGLITADVTVRYNYISRPMSWRDPIIPSPKAVTASPAQGSLPAGTYAYRVIARRPVGIGSHGRSPSSIEVRLTIAGGGVRVSWAPVPDAVDYFVYGRRAGAPDRYWVVSTTSYTDTGEGGTATTLPADEGTTWTIKNLFELKNARRVLVEYNIFENNWKSGQAGYSILFTVRNQDGGCTWCVVADVTFQYNVVRNVGGGINILGHDDNYPSGQATNIRIRHNLMTNVTTTLGGSGWFLLLGEAPRDIFVDHNTVQNDGTTSVYAWGREPSGAPRQILGVQLTNNALRHGDYGINGDGFSFGTTTLAGYFPDLVMRSTWMAGGTASRYPAGNLFAGTFESGFVDAARGDYRAAPGGILAGAATDGTNIGADITTLLRGVSGVVAGMPPTGAVPTTPPPAPPPAPTPISLGAPGNVRMIVR